MGFKVHSPNGPTAMAGDNVFVVSADPGSYDATVASPVTLEGYDDAPDELASRDNVRIWHLGADDDAGELFDELGEGDVVLFYGDGRYVGVGTVGTAFRDENRWAGDALWQGLAAEFVFTVDDFEAVDLSRAAVHAVFDYSANYYPSAPMRIPDDRVTNSPGAIYEAVTRYDQQD